MSKMLTRDNSEGVQERGVRVISPGKGDDLQFSPGGSRVRECVEHELAPKVGGVHSQVSMTWTETCRSPIATVAGAVGVAQFGDAYRDAERPPA